MNTERVQSVYPGMSKHVKGQPTDLNISVLREFFGGAQCQLNQIESTSVPHMRRCLKAGLLVVEGDFLLLTNEGVEAIKAYEAKYPTLCKS